MIAEFLIYEGKVAVLMAVFYLFYRLLLSRETLHAVNRVVLIATAVSSFILPIIHLTRYRTVAYPDITLETGEGAIDPTALTEMAGESPWILFLFGVFILGAFIIITRIAFAIVKVRRILSKGRPIILEDGTEITVIEEDIAPFSWMGSIVMSRDDYESGNKHIIAHEKAHIAFRHSIDILIVDTLSAFQWFNPVMWMLLSDLRAIHEYEADDAVLKKGADIREYQYSLIKKAVSGSGYSITNSFNHSILKNRITMMSKQKSKAGAALKALYVLPLLCGALALNAKTVYKFNENPDDTKRQTVLTPVAIWVGNDSEQTSEELKPFKVPEGVVPLDEVDILPEFNLNGKKLFNEWLSTRLRRPSGCKHSGQLAVAFILNEHGEILPAIEAEGMCPEVRKMVSNIIMETSGYWIPAKKNGKAVPVLLVQPISFKVSNPDEPIPFERIEFFENVEVKPKFLGSNDISTFSRWVNENLRYPKEAHDKGIQGQVTLSFAVGTDGRVHNIYIIESAGEILDNEAIRVVSASPSWDPGIHDGKPIAVRITFPIIFKLR